MPTVLSHPHKHLIRDLWPDKHLYAATLLLLGAGIGAGFALSAELVPITFGADMPTSIAGWNWPFGVVLPAIAAPLAIAAYRLRRPWMGFVAAGVEFASAGALGVVPLLAIAATGFLIAGRREGEHDNLATKDLHAHHWPDKALAAALLFAVGGLVALVWGGMLMSGWLSVRSLDVMIWGLASIAIGLFALVGAFLSYRQQSYWACVASAVLVALSFGFVVIGPALAIGAGLLLARARREGEFGA